jgi:hypothetical protein
MEKKGAIGVMAIVGIVAAVVVAVFIGMSAFQASGGAGDDGLAGTDDQPLVTTQKCQDDGTNSLFVAVKNPINATLHYEDENIVVVSEDGEQIATGTATAGATLAYATINIPCVDGGYAGTVYGLLDASETATIGEYDFEGDTSETVIMMAPPTGSLDIVSYDTTFTNFTDTNSVDGAGAGCTETEAVTNSVSTIGSGESFTRYVDFKQATAFHMYGSEVAGEAGILIGIDNQNASSWNSGDIKISSISGGGNLKAVDCSDYQDSTAAEDLDECYTMDAIGSSDPTRRLKVEGTANGGNPFSDLQVVFIDLGYFEDIAGDIVYAGHNTARTTVGVATDCSLTINLA